MRPSLSSSSCSGTTRSFGKVSLEPYPGRFAANCSSLANDEFGARAICSRFYVKDREVISTMETVLQTMLEDVRGFCETR